MQFYIIITLLIFEWEIDYYFNYKGTKYKIKIIRVVFDKNNKISI